MAGASCSRSRCIAGWEYGARTLGPLFFAPPLETAQRLWALAASGQMFADIVATLRVAVAGFAIAGIVGVILPFLLRRSPRATEAVEPAIMFTMGIPKYALAPWLILWFGIGDMPKLVVVAWWCSTSCSSPPSPASAASTAAWSAWRA